jgi:PilZ domain
LVNVIEIISCSKRKKRGNMNFPPGVGNKFKSIITGATYVVKKIRDKMVILERHNKKSQLVTELSNLKLFFKKEEKEEESKPRYGTLNLEKRRYPRFSVDLLVEYNRKDLVVRQGRVINASEGGLLVYFPEQMEIGQLLRLNPFFHFRL